MQEANFIVRALAGSIKANGDIQDSVSHVVSLVWKYVVITVDQCLNYQERRYSNLRSRYNMAVKEAVAKRTEHFE